MKSPRPFVSVLTPFYNTDAYLEECIESVLKQTYSNWEYVLVNNCSTDGSATIAENYARRYPTKIRLAHNPSFLSQVGNYNRALTLISPNSKYCKVVQADDLLFPQCLELMVDVAEQDSSVGVVGSYGLEGIFVCFDGVPFRSSTMAGRTASRLFFVDGRYLFGSPTQLMLRSDLVRERSPFYDEAYIPFEDAAIIFELLKKWNFGFVHQVLTFSRRDNASVMKSLMVLDCARAFDLFMLRDFGGAFLEPCEYKVQLRKKERAYVQLLVDAIVGVRGIEFWKFHRQMVKRMNYSFWSPRIWWLLFLSVCDVVFNPKQTASTIVDAFRRGLQKVKPKLAKARNNVVEKGDGLTKSHLLP